VKKLILTEEEKSRIKKLYNISEQDSTFNPLQVVLNAAMKKLKDLESGVTEPNDNETSIDSDTTSFEPGEYFVDPNYENVKIKYGQMAIPLNRDAEILLKSIGAVAGKNELFVSSTLRTYEDQARVNKQNSRSNIIKWYCKGDANCDLVKKWDLFKSGQMTQQQFADFLKNRDKELGKTMSNHIPGYSIDITPYDSKIVDAASKIQKQGNSGIKKIVPEENNDAVHLDFTFKVTGQSGVVGPKKIDSASKITKKEGIIIDKKNNSSNYAIVFGGYPSNKYGAEFMYGKGTNVLTNKNVVYSNFENSLDSVINYLKSQNPDAKITSVSGFSAGGKNAWDAATKGYKVGLIDPVVPDFASQIVGKDFTGNLPSNIKMISRQENWSGNLRKHGERLANLESTQPQVKRNINHSDMPEKFFKEFKDFV
jgi:hypothetical protein